MSTTNTFELLETIILEKQLHKTSRNQRDCSALIANKMNYTDQIPNIYHAILWAGIENHNDHERACDVARKALRPLPKPHVYDISFCGYLQRVMDSATRAVYNLSVARDKVVVNETITLGGTGVDWAQDIADEVGIDASSLATLRLQIEEVYTNLNYIHLDLQSKFKENYDDLYMYAPSVQDDQNNWSVPFKTNDFSEACEAIELSNREFQENRGSGVIDLGLYDSSYLPGAKRIENVAAPRSSEPDFEDDDIDRAFA